jgi:origin recognition complex subunit 1
MMMNDEFVDQVLFSADDSEIENAMVAQTTVAPPSPRKEQSIDIDNKEKSFNSSQTTLDDVAIQLQLSSVPRALPCRDRERNALESFLRQHISQRRGCCSYVYGVPGSGKSETLRQVMRTLAEANDVGAFKFVEINGLQLESAEHAYLALWNAVAPTPANAETTPLAALARFTAWAAKSHQYVVVALDEIDVMLSRQQRVLYNFFDWGARPELAVAVVGISNTMDLPERMLPRVASRLGLHRVPFRAYQTDDLAEIVAARLRACDGEHLVDSDAVLFAARLVANMHGDARRVLDICRAAVRRVADRGNARAVVQLADVDAAAKQMFGSSIGGDCIAHLAPLPRRYLTALVREAQNASAVDRDVTVMHGAVSARVRYMDVADTVGAGESAPKRSRAQLALALAPLISSGAVFCDTPQLGALQPLQLNMAPDDVRYALVDSNSSEQQR